jgi:hypothetical protein
MQQLGMTLELRLRLECGLCGTPLYSKKCKDTEFRSVLFGHKAYAVCPICHAEKDNQDDPKWRAKVDRWIRKTA